MSYLLAICLFVVFNFSQVYGHSGEGHENSKPVDDIELDGDGFKIISMEPSKKELDEINVIYKKNVKKIFSNKCLSCHGVNNSPPWYFEIPGVKQLINSDMKEAKKHMDMSNDFPFGGHGRPAEDLNALRKTIKKGEMPPLRYRFMHWDSKLTKAEIKVINAWIENSQKILNKK